MDFNCVICESIRELIRSILLILDKEHELFFLELWLLEFCLARLSSGVDGFFFTFSFEDFGFVSLISLWALCVLGDLDDEELDEADLIAINY